MLISREYLSRKKTPPHAAAILMAAALTANAEAPAGGELAAAIRAADYPCAHVIEVIAAGDAVWRVQCNSGRFLVQRSGKDTYSVSRID